MKAWRHSGIWLAVAGLAVGSLGADRALASAEDEERIFRQEALAHAGAIASAYRRLEHHILLESTAITTWSGLPPAVVGWLPSWTTRGLKSEYCEETLLVYLDPNAGELKGVGGDHRSVHVAPFAYVSDGNEGQFPALHWLEGSVAEGGKGRPTVPLPACMTGLPSGRAALAGAVKDPFVNIRDGYTHEVRWEPCPLNTHGPGKRFAREMVQPENSRGEPTGPAVPGIWRLVADACRADYDGYEYWTVACQSTAGAPHDRVIEGEEVWRKPKTVTADGAVYGTPEMVSSTCWTAVAEVTRTPVISEISRQESRSVACERGYTGTRRYLRTRTTRSTKFPWDATPVVTVRYTAWRHSSSSCEAEEGGEPPVCDPGKEVCTGTTDCEATDPECGESKVVVGKPETFTVDVDERRPRECKLINSSWTGTYEETREIRYQYTLYGDGTRSVPVIIGTGVWWMSKDNCDVPPGSGPPGTPGGGVCGPPGDGSGSPGEGDCTGMDSSIAEGLAGVTGGSGGSGGGGGCYLTTAVVEHRGLEGDDGPTLTALRHFRDTYMMETPLRRALVRLYYRLAPAISRDLEANAPAWEEIGGHIDSAVAALESGDRGKAFRAYWAASVKAFSLWAAFKVRRALA